MLTKLRTFASLYRELGPRWTLFRLAYAFRLRTGLIRLQMPMGEWSDYKNRISTKPAGRVERAFFRLVSRPSDLPANIPWNPQLAVDEANRLLNGEIKYFAHEFVKTGFPPNWNKDYFSDHVTLSEAKGLYHNERDSSVALRSSHRPDASRENDINKHWSQISDDHVIARSPQGDEAIPLSHTDIKFIWEPNRFAFTYTLVCAYAASHDEKYPAAFWTLIEDWAQHNPPNTGPNWMDGQEIALRLMAWTFGYHAFLNSPSTTPQRKENFTLYIAAQTERIYRNIDYAISTKSNHTISEAFGLWLVGLLFPELKNSQKYFSLGRKLLEGEAATQIFPDGSYSMYSLNYHRFILHIYLYAIRLGEINHSPFSTQLINSVTKSVEYLSKLINLQTGEMSVYGSNDGALVLPLNNCDFTDYRPLLQLGWYITKKQFLFEPGLWDEDVFWLCSEINLTPNPSPERRGERLPSPVGRRAGDEGETSFPHGGTYLLRNTDSHVLIHCTDFTSRPSHADQLHVDLWIHGHNIAIDAGTYLYSGQSPWRNGLAHTSVHNTVTVDHKDQMQMVSRFTWTNWSKGKVLQHKDNLWQGEHDGYKPVNHQRTVMALENDRWLVIDHLVANEPHYYVLHWLLADVGVQELAAAHGLILKVSDSKLSDSRVKIQMGLLEGDGNFSVVRADPESIRGWRSRYYGHREPALSLRLEATRPQVTFWSFFGYEQDTIELKDQTLSINSLPIPF